MNVKILCHSCEGRRWIHETEFGSNKDIKVLCPECNGIGFVLMDSFEPKEEAKAK